MYLRELFIKNNGPIRNLHLELAFNDKGPIPHIIVGSNGSGKTNLLSIIADALMQGASDSFTDVLTRSGSGRSYFRLLGGTTVTSGEENGFSVLKFTDGGDDLHFNENSGGISTEEAAALTPESLKSGLTWHEKTSTKIFTGSDDKKKMVFESGVYAFFPASRSETPHWFNHESIAEDTFDVSPRYRSELGKPMFVERGLDALAQWLLGVITESRLDVVKAGFEDDGKDKDHVSVTLDTSEYWPTQSALYWANRVLKIIMGDPEAKFIWTGRWSARKVGIQSKQGPLTNGLNALSGGQATLLATFGTILRYADGAQLIPTNAEGIVIIDELDAHMHLDLQLSTLPELISLFPKVQFIISSHSPFFTIGLERTLSSEDIRIIELPSGMPVITEAYGEFQKALDTLRETKAFTHIIHDEIRSGTAPIIFVAGETDVKYFRTAARILGYPHLEEMFHWIGAESGVGGGKFTGDPNLDRAVEFLRCNPSLTSRKIVAIYDCDAKKESAQFGDLHVISLDQIVDAQCDKGIENLLAKSVSLEGMQEMIEVDNGYGKMNTFWKLRKMPLCNSLCGTDANPEHFQNFRSILDRIDKIVGTESDGKAEEAQIQEETATV